MDRAKIKAEQVSRVIRVTPIGDTGDAAQRTIKLSQSANINYVVRDASIAKVEIGPANQQVFHRGVFVKDECRFE